MLESGDRLRLVEQVLFRQLTQPEEFPPLRLFLSMMPINQVSEQPAYVVVMGRLARHQGHSLEHPLAERYRHRCPFAWLTLWLLLHKWPRNTCAVPDLLG